MHIKSFKGSSHFEQGLSRPRSQGCQPFPYYEPAVPLAGDRDGYNFKSEVMNYRHSTPSPPPQLPLNRPLSACPSEFHSKALVVGNEVCGNDRYISRDQLDYGACSTFSVLECLTDDSSGFFDTTGQTSTLCIPSDKYLCEQLNGTDSVTADPPERLDQTGNESVAAWWKQLVGKYPLLLPLAEEYLWHETCLELEQLNKPLRGFENDIGAVLARCSRKELEYIAERFLVQRSWGYITLRNVLRVLVGAATILFCCREVNSKIWYATLCSLWGLGPVYISR